MQRNYISKFRPLLRQVYGFDTFAPKLLTPCTIQTSSFIRNQFGGAGPGKLPPKMAKLQQRYQEDNDKPVFLKGGPMDNVLYRLTLILCVLGTIGDLWLWFGYILSELL